MSRIFWDTNVFIYLFENHPVHRAEAMRLRRKMVQRGDELLTSWLTVGEVQVQGTSGKRRADRHAYKQAIVQTSTLVAFGEQASESYRIIRDSSAVRGPDALQLACAAASGVELFVTNDKALHGLNVPGIHFVTSIAAAESLL